VTDATGGANAGSGGRGSGGSAGGATGGATGPGGTVAQGGSSLNGGGSGSGGTRAAGGATGPVAGVSSGGSVVTGGSAVGSGGSKGSGGVPAAGGSAAGGAASGGVTSPGGSSGQGGATGAGGATGKDGATGAGGATSAGPAIAFPGAQGFGKKATGGRNGVVYHVTNLNDSGAGSFRDAVGTSGRVVVFDVGGYIQLQTAVSAKSNLTIAGQTAPGGIGFRGGEISFASQSNIIMRHIRIRPGSETASTDDDALSLYLANTVIVDHSSLEFAPWNNIDGVGDSSKALVEDITFQDSLVADPTGQQFGCHSESVNSSWSWYRNIFANSHNRNPLAKVNNVFVNNLLYNCQAGYTTHTSTNFTHDIINNYFVAGPSSSSSDFPWFQIDQNQSIYCTGNLYDSNKDGTLNGTTTTPDWYQGPGTILSSPWSSESTAYPTLDAASAARVAVSRAGALPRDPMDQLIINQVKTLGKGASGTGAGSAGSLYTSQTETGLDNNGYGTITAGTKPADSDNDGMPDDWENANGSDPQKDDAMTKASDGYALIEHYINWLAEPRASTVTGTAVDVDLSAFADGFGGVSPSYAVSGAQSGTVTLQSDNHSAHFQPSDGFKGLGSFWFTVTGSDGTKYTDQVVVLVAP